MNVQVLSTAFSPPEAMMSTKYEVITYWTGCRTHGDTREDALAKAEDAIRGWL